MKITISNPFHSFTSELKVFRQFRIDHNYHTWQHYLKRSSSNGLSGLKHKTMYSSVYGPPVGRSYIGRESNGYRSYNDMTGSPSGTRRYLGAGNGNGSLGASHYDFPPSRYRPPLPTYTMQNVSRSSSYANSANHSKNSLSTMSAGSGANGDIYGNSR